MPAVSFSSTPTANTAHTPRTPLRRQSEKLARNLSAFGVLGPDEGPEAQKFRSWGLKPFRFTATAHTVERFPGGRWADVYRHVSLTCWAFTEGAAHVVASEQITNICPAQNWAVLPAT